MFYFTNLVKSSDYHQAACLTVKTFPLEGVSDRFGSLCFFLFFFTDVAFVVGRQEPLWTTKPLIIVMDLGTDKLLVNHILAQVEDSFEMHLDVLYSIFPFFTALTYSPHIAFCMIGSWSVLYRTVCLDSVAPFQCFIPFALENSQRLCLENLIVLQHKPDSMVVN